MKWNNGIGFFFATLLLGMILGLLPFSPERVALHQLKGQWLKDLNFRHAIAKHCSSLVSASNSPLERDLVEGWPTASAEVRPCLLTSVSSDADRFELIHRSHFRIQVTSADGQTQLERAYRTEFPRPLALLPLASVLLALLFELPTWAVLGALLVHPFFLTGLNLVAAIHQALRATFLALQTDRTLPGALLLALWVILYRERFPEGRSHRPTTRRLQDRLNGLLFTAIGLWSPLTHTLVGRLVYPFRATVLRIQGLLNAQLLVLGFSLYILSLSSRTSWAEFGQNLLLPRYFTFAALFFYCIYREESNRIARAVLWRLPDLKPSVLAVISVELAAALWKPLGSLPTLTRMGVALVTIEIWKAGLPFLTTTRRHSRVFLAILVGSILATWSVQSGLVDLIQVLANPRSHPSIIVVSCFAMATVLGFTTGGVTTSFFTMYALLMQTHNLPLVRAALIDGLLLGILLCPYSFFNLVTAQLFGIKLSALLQLRVQQLAGPAAIGFLVFSLSSLSTVGILRPTTFVFVCLAIGFWKLSRLGWRLPLES